MKAILEDAFTGGGVPVNLEIEREGGHVRLIITPCAEGGEAFQMVLTVEGEDFNEGK